MKFKAKITRMGDGNSKIKAIADVSFEGGFRVTGIKVCQGSKGLFLGMPSNSYTNSDGEKKYTDIFFPTTKEAREALTKRLSPKKCFPSTRQNFHRHRNRLHQRLRLRLNLTSENPALRMTSRTFLMNLLCDVQETVLCKLVKK